MDDASGHGYRKRYFVLFSKKLNMDQLQHAIATLGDQGEGGIEGG
jgi:hypothetical protein